MSTKVSSLPCRYSATGGISHSLTQVKARRAKQMSCLTKIHTRSYCSTTCLVVCLLVTANRLESQKSSSFPNSTSHGTCRLYKSICYFVKCSLFAAVKKKSPATLIPQSFIYSFLLAWARYITLCLFLFGLAQMVNVCIGFSEFN